MWRNKYYNALPANTNATITQISGRDRLVSGNESLEQNKPLQQVLPKGFQMTDYMLIGGAILIVGIGLALFLRKRK